MTDELRKLAEAATQGPWLAGINAAPIGSTIEICSVNKNDALFIAAAKPAAVIALLNEITALRAKVKSQAEALTKADAVFADPILAAEFTPDLRGTFGDDEFQAALAIRRAAQEATDE